LLLGSGERLHGRLEELSVVLRIKSVLFLAAPEQMISLGIYLTLGFF